MTFLRTILCFAGIALSCAAYGFEDTGAFYREEIFQDPGQTCGSLCISNPNYFESYIYQQDRNSRLFGPAASDVGKRIKEKEINALNYKKFKGSDYIQGLGWGPDSKVNKFFSRQTVRWSRVARDAGFQSAENDRSFTVALLREVRKPILYYLRDRLRKPYRSKRKLKLNDKVKVWLLEQAVDTGASTLNLDSFGGVQGSGSNVDFDIKNLIVKFNPRLDPFKGKYGVRFKAQRHNRKNRPVFLGLNANYCNSDAGFGDRLCTFEYELSTNISFVNPSRRWASSAYISYQTESLDEDAYLIDGQLFDHQPWVGGITVTYSFY